jgi:hypothetical protein
MNLGPELFCKICGSNTYDKEWGLCHKDWCEKDQRYGRNPDPREPEKEVVNNSPKQASFSLEMIMDLWAFHGGQNVF